MWVPTEGLKIWKELSQRWIYDSFPPTMHPRDNTYSAPPTITAFAPPWINTVLFYSGVRPPSATFECNRRGLTNGMMDECFGSWCGLDRAKLQLLYIKTEYGLTKRLIDSHHEPCTTIAKSTASTNHVWLYTRPLIWTIRMSDTANASAWIIE